MTQIDISNIKWLGHASFRINAGPIVIYIDPWQLGKDPYPADLILITHDHGDHCSPDDVAKIQTEKTIIITVKDAAEKLVGDIQIIQPGDQRTIKGVEICAVPAYNVTKFRSPGVPFHPKEKGYVGFVVTIKNQRIYHAGDTDIIPEMANIEANIAILPVSGIYVMTPEEAVKAAEIMNPDVIIPMHVGRGIGSNKDIESLLSSSEIPVIVMDFPPDIGNIS